VKQRLLIIFAYHFPPENAVGGLRPFRFYKYLSRQGVRCHVITAAHGASEIGPDIETVPDRNAVRRQGLGGEFERGVRKLLWPGAVGIHWSIHAARAAEAFCDREKGATVTVLSTFPPMGAHLAGWRLARRNHLPWVADFRDPLGDNPADGVDSRLRKRHLLWLEGRMVHAAQMVIANTDAAADRMRKQYPDCQPKIRLLWNGFDPEDRIAPQPAPERTSRVISHVGELYGGRQATPVLETIARLIEHGRLKPGQVRLYLVGAADRRTLPSAEFLDRATAQGWLQLVTDTVPRVEARRITATSDGLLLIQPQSNVQVPGKLFEYLQTGRPILAFLPHNSPSERILANSGVPYRCIYPDDTEAALEHAVGEFFQLLPGSYRPNAWFDEQFNAERQAQTLGQWLDCI
jgi:glycosyltransferase involved in cell wall biosynthesis